ncbi:PHP domain-containing protein [Tessaracoccus caeni]|uniref:PHP domain-containing protein n=1 Tax=Tessaracoccus caeni TaxID=3031239 RepID=UPI0023DCD2B7|nr:PHP domain-containing protein [Tessaracoccus caeni]MDF1488450.1 PHP domain-containing protein [Tessaracoccus caeni]
MKIDLHTHSKVSDGTDSPTSVVMQAVAAGLTVIALTDHDTFDGLKEAQEAGRRMGLTVLGGIEMSTAKDGHSVHLLGYGCDPTDKELGEELARIRSGRMDRLPEMCRRLTEAGLEITPDEVRETAQWPPAVGRPHVADTMVKKGYVKSRKQAFYEWLAEGKPGFVTRYACPVERAIDLIHRARGVAVIAHPWGRQGRAVMTAEYLEFLAREHELEGIEVDHEDHDEDERSLLFELGGRLGLIRTGSSDFHGTGKEGHPLGGNLTRPSAYRDLINRIRRRGGLA